MFVPESLSYLLSVQLNVLHLLGILEKNHLLDYVHLVFDINGFVEFPIICKKKKKSTVQFELSAGSCVEGKAG